MSPTECGGLATHLAALLLIVLPAFGCSDSGTGGEADAGNGVIVPEREDAVIFASGDLTLEGTLLVPEHFENDKLPAVILAHGSGPMDRDETISGQLGMSFGFEISVFAEVAASLADAGYVVLRYDKRTCTLANGCDNSYPTPDSNIVVGDFVADVDAGLDWLASRDDVQAESLYFVGHSQGASFAPELLAGRDDLKAAVMLASPYRPVDVLLGYQADWTRMLLEALGMSEGEIDAQRVILDQAVLELEQLRAGTFAGNTIMGAPVLFWQSWMDLGDEAAQIVTTLDKPLMALSGDYDWNVPATETELWEEAFVGATANPGHEAVTLPCISHAMNCISEPDWTMLTPSDIGRNVDPAVTAELVRFLEGTR